MVRISSIRDRRDDETPALNRRQVLQGAAGLAGGAALGLNASGAGAQGATPGASPEASPEASPATADVIPSGVEGVPDAYLRQPDPFVSYDGVPGEGGTVRAFLIGYNPPPVSRDDNPYWQELERRLGVTWEPDITPQPDYGAKSATLIASGDIPDLFTINPGQNAAQQYQAMSQGAFLDLTPYVTGDALQQFRNLAAFPQYMWDNVKFQGKIFGVPKPLWRNGNLPFFRGDWAETLGLGAPTNAQEMHDLLVGFATGDPNGNGNVDTWGMGRFNGSWWSWDNLVSQQTFRLPNTWRLNDDGTLTHMTETEEFAQAIEFQAQLFKDGAFHPDSPAMTFALAQDAFVGGKTGLHYEGFLSFYGMGSVSDRARDVDPAATMVPLVPPGADGGQGVTYYESGFFGYTGIPSSTGDENRILELLRILDYLAAPFGSEERNFFDNGLEGVHHNVDPNTGARIATDQLRIDRGDMTSAMNGQAVYYYPDTPELAVEIQKVALEAIAIGVDNPVRTVYSETQTGEGATLDQFAQDTITAIVTGREPVDTLGAKIDEWKTRGGDKVRSELEDALASQ